MRKAFILLAMAALTAFGGMSQNVRTVEMNFQHPATIHPPTAPPTIPTNQDERASYHYSYINGVDLLTQGVTLTLRDGLHNEGEDPKHSYTWRKGYDDNGTKRTENTSEGTYYLEIRTSDNPDIISSDPSQQTKVTFTAPSGSTIKKIEIPGQSVLNSCEYLTPINPEDGTATFDSSTFMWSFTPAEGKILESVTFTCPRKKSNGVNMSTRKIYKVYVTLEGPDTPVVTKTVSYNFQRPETITPQGYAPAVPDVPEERSSMYEININGIEFISEGVTLTSTGGLHNEGQTPPSNYTWRRGYDDFYNKRPTSDKLEGTYYLNLRMSGTDDDIATDPTQKQLLTVKAPVGATIKEVKIHGLSAANAAQYLQLTDPDAGTYTTDNSTRVNTFTSTEGMKLTEVSFTCPRKRPDGVNLSGYLVANVEATIEMKDLPEPEPEGLPIPYSRKFKDIDGMTVIDANNDGNTWEYNLSNARCTAPVGDANTNTEGDDWIITPGLAMYSGKYYKVYTPFVPQYGTPGKVEVKLGSSATAEGMTLDVMPTTEFDSRMDCINYVKIPSNGTYYLGVHSVTPRTGALYVKLPSIDIYEPMVPTVPSAITDLKVSPASDGVKPYKVTITFKAPSTDMDGNPLTANLEKVVIGNGTYAGNALQTVSKTFTDVTPGQELTYTYTQKSTGYKTFGIVTYNASGIGAETYTKSIYVGVNKPDEPTDLNISETDTTGEVILSWKAPETDCDGNPINPDLIKYHLTDGLTFQTIARDVKSTTYTYKTGVTNDQQFFRFYIVAETDGGSTMSVGSPSVAIGKPLTTPLTEGFERLNVMPVDFTADGGKSTIFHEGDMSGAIKPWSAEGDGCSVAMYAYDAKSHPSMLTGKIDLSGLTSPVISFDIFVPTSTDGTRLLDNNELVVKARTPQGEFKELGKVRVGDLNDKGWNRMTYSLTEFAGKTVQFQFEGNLIDYPNGTDSQSFVFMDRMQVREAHSGSDLRAIHLETPAVAEQSYEFRISTYVENDGVTPVKGASVELYRNGKKSDSRDLPVLAPGRIEHVVFNQTLNAADGAEAVYKAIIVSDPDDKEENNTTDEKKVNYKTSMHPSPESLAGTLDNSAVMLTWTPPTLPSGTAVQITESFEIEEKFAVDSLGDWTFYDLDKGTLGLPTGMVLEGLNEGKTQYAWIIADESLFQAQGMAHSGTHFMTGFFNHDGRTNNDIAVSPELNGEAQTLTFYAISFASKYPETIDVWYSDGTRDINDFKRLGGIDYVPSEWTKFSFDLPAGARFFGIRHVSGDAWIVGVDDVTFTPMEPGKDVELVGYNIYRDGERLNERPVTDTSYTDNKAEDGKHLYCISAVYDKGESLACAPIEIAFSSVENVTSDVTGIRGEHGCISVTSTAEIRVEIFTTAGIDVADETCGIGVTNIPVEPGIYMVRIGFSTVKVIVK